MNEDQMYDAAEREMDLYRNEISRITRQRDDLRAAVHALMADLEQSAAATAPSKKSDIELTVAERLGLLLDQP